MKRCPRCRQTYTDEILKFCRDDGALLQTSNSSTDSSDTLLLPDARLSGALPTQLLQSETARAKETTAPIEGASGTETGKLTAAAEIKRRKRGVAVVSLALSLAAVGLGYWLFGHHPSSSSSKRASVESIAVLPFENASGDVNLDYLSEGVSESVIDRLSQLPQLKVIARSSSFRYRGQNLNLQEIASALGVQAIVTGRVVPRNDSYQIRVELVDTRENTHLWGKTFTRRASDVQILQADISRELAETLRVRLSGTQAQQIAGEGTINPQAYEMLLRGRFYFNKAGEPKNFQKAVEYFERAIALDPNYALAYAVLVEAYSFGGISRGLNREQHEMKLEAAARKALELDPNLAEAHNSMATLKRNKWEWEEAERAYLRAIELNPNLPQAHSGYAFYLNLMGRHAEALASVERARELDPVSLIINTSVGVINLRMRRYDEAIEASKKAIQLGERAMFARRTLGAAYAAKGMFVEAAAEFEEAFKIAGGESSAVEALLGAAYAKTGRRAKAEEILQKIIALEGKRLPAESAVLSDTLGRRDEAFAVLEKAYSERLQSLPYIAVDPSYESLRSDPRFQSLLRRMELSP